jgi:hypothetical protein
LLSNSRELTWEPVIVSIPSVKFIVYN